MADKMKKIKINNRGMYTTSRGRFMGPIGPYKERVQNILVMITRENADITEILDDGKEVKLTIQNFDKDNSGVVEEKVITPVKEEKEEVPVENVPIQTARQMSKKERKKMEYEKKLAEKASTEVKEETKVETPVKEEAKKEEVPSTKEEVKPEVKPDTTVPADAIES